MEDGGWRKKEEIYILYTYLSRFFCPVVPLDVKKKKVLGLALPGVGVRRVIIGGRQAVENITK